MRFTSLAFMAFALLTACAPPATLSPPVLLTESHEPTSTPEGVMVLLAPATTTPVVVASALPLPARTMIPSPAPLPAATPTLGAIPTRAPSPSPRPSFTPTESAAARYHPAYGIDYAHPALYLAAGEQTHLSDVSPFGALVHNSASSAPRIDGYRLGEIYRWIRRSFTTWSTGGRTIGSVTTDQLFAERRLGGCHDWAVVYASMARSLGYPAVVVDTASVAWMKLFAGGQKGTYVGHVFVEIYAAGKWMLVDSTNNWWVENDYGPSNAVIPLKGNIAGAANEAYGFYVMRKGVDTWGYGIRSVGQLNKFMEETAHQVKMETLTYPTYAFERLP